MSESDSKLTSNEAAQALWNDWPVGYQRASAPEGTSEFFEQVRAYRYGYETPWISRIFDFPSLAGKRILEIGVGLGIDAAELVAHGAVYTGLDITERHLRLTKENLTQQFGNPNRFQLLQGDLTEVEFTEPFDAVYSFGVLHHIAHQTAYLRKIRSILVPGGELRFAVYSKYSFFNIYMIVTWILRNRMRAPLHDWQSHLAERSQLGSPVVIKIVSRKEIQRSLEQSGFHVVRYSKRGFVSRYLPFLGKYCRPDGELLNFLGSLLGWYHCFTCRAISDFGHSSSNTVPHIAVDVR